MESKFKIMRTNGSSLTVLVNGFTYNLELSMKDSFDIGMSREFQIKNNLQVQEGLFFNEGDIRCMHTSKVVKGTLNLCGITLKDILLLRYTDCKDDALFISMDIFDKVLFTHDSIELSYSEENVNTWVEQHNEKITAMCTGSILFGHDYMNVDNPLGKIDAEEYKYTPVEFVDALSAEIYKCAMGEYGKDSYKYLSDYSFRLDYPFQLVPKEIIQKSYEEWKSKEHYNIWEIPYPDFEVKRGTLSTEEINTLMSYFEPDA